MAFAIFNSDLMTATTDASKHVFFKITSSAVQNGSVVKIGALVSGERNSYTYTAPIAATPITAIAILTSPELMSDERKKNLNEFTNEVGTTARGFMVEKGDVFSLTTDGLTGSEIAVGDIVELAAATKLKVVASATGLTSGSTKVGTVIEVVSNVIRIRVGD